LFAESIPTSMLGFPSRRNYSCRNLLRRNQTVSEHSAHGVAMRPHSNKVMSAPLLFWAVGSTLLNDKYNYDTKAMRPGVYERLRFGNRREIGPWVMLYLLTEESRQRMSGMCHILCNGRNVGNDAFGFEPSTIVTFTIPGQINYVIIK